MKRAMESCVYEGRVRHRRFQPVEHSFEYSIFMLYLDLGELERVFEGHWLWSTRRAAVARFRRADHLGDPAVPLDDAVRDLVLQRVGRRPTGPIRLLTHLAYFGYGFNPVSFYYVYDAAGRDVETIVAEVNNTPWGEQHCYVFPCSTDGDMQNAHRFRFDKEFHVSPFMEMELQYDWRFVDPAHKLTVHMDSLRDGAKFFDSTMILERREIAGRSLARVLVRYPLMTTQVIAAIHYQAFRLWMRRVPSFEHPQWKTLQSDTTR